MKIHGRSPDPQKVIQAIEELLHTSKSSVLVEPISGGSNIEVKINVPWSSDAETSRKQLEIFKDIAAIIADARV